MTLDLTWVVFDIIGTVAFALSGALVGLSRKMDAFGIVVLAVLTAVGGGIIRDILVGIFPPSALTNTTNLLLSVATAMMVSVVYGRFHLAPAQKRYDELMELMASEELYNDADAFDAAMKEYTALSKKIPLLEEEWIELTDKIEAGV